MNSVANKQDLGQDREETPVHNAEELTGGGSLAQIEFRGQTYTLRITRAGKLILTK
ncbi:MAG: hemin uptake protein HemP [Jhaorihella sp.]